jgi:peptidoglycan/xylan/chitin deacetylase (PgdA/CDA1 family)
LINQLESAASLIRKGLLAHGVQPSSLGWFRPSGGWPTPQIIQWAEHHGCRALLGSIWPFDGLLLSLLSPEARLELQQEFVQRFTHLGDIIVMRDTSEFNPRTRETLRLVVPSLMAQGYAFVSLSDLLGCIGWRKFHTLL